MLHAFTRVQRSDSRFVVKVGENCKISRSLWVFVQDRAHRDSIVECCDRTANCIESLEHSCGIGRLTPVGWNTDNNLHYSRMKHVADFQASLQPGNDSACPSRMFVLEQPQCVPQPSSLYCRIVCIVTSSPNGGGGVAAAIIHRHPSDMWPHSDGSGGDGGGSGFGERAPFRGLWCVQMVVHREITRGCAQLHGYSECKTFGWPTPIRPMMLRTTYDNGNVHCRSVDSNLYTISNEMLKRQLRAWPSPVIWRETLYIGKIHWIWRSTTLRISYADNCLRLRCLRVMIMRKSVRQKCKSCFSCI